jgi:hypothetical protein
VSKWALYRDVALLVGGSLGVVALWIIFRENIPDRWKMMAMFGGLLLLNVLIKLIIPAHATLRLVRWIYLLLVGAIILTAAFLAGDWNILGDWTLPALIGLALLYWLVHAMLGPRFKDDADATKS